jgi:hypothetical protein
MSYCKQISPAFPASDNARPVAIVGAGGTAINDLQLMIPPPAKSAPIPAAVSPGRGDTTGISARRAVVDGDAVLPADEGKALAQFQQKLLEVVAQQRFKLGFRYLPGFGHLQELENIRLAQQVGGLFDDLALRRELQDAGLVLAGSQTQEQGAFFLPDQFSYRPVFARGLLLVKAPLQRIIDFQQFDNVRPAE